MNAVVERIEGVGIISAFIEDIAAMNAGECVGQWISLPASDNELNDVFETLRMGGKQYGGGEEFNVSDFKLPDDLSGLKYDFHHFVGIHELNRVADYVSELDEYERADFATICDVTGNFAEALDYFENDRYLILHDVNDDADLGGELFEQGYLPFIVPDELIPYIDFERIGRDARLSGEWTITGKGTAVMLE